MLVPFLAACSRARGKGVRRIFYEDGLWIHETSQGYFAYHQPFLRLDMRKLDALARANFFWGYTPTPGDVVIDVGAGVGEEALTFSRAIGAHGKLICIEAHPRTYRCLEKLVQYNSLCNVITIHAAVADPSREFAIIEDSSEYLQNSVDTQNGISVPAMTLDKIHQRLRLGRVQFLKMNIEGAERFAMSGMTQTLKQTDVLCISCHDFLAEKGRGQQLRTKAAIKDFFRQNGLQVVERIDNSLPPYIRDQVWGYKEGVIPPGMRNQIIPM